MDKTIVITGANSYLGRMVVRMLLRTTDYYIIAVCSLRINEIPEERDRIKYFRSDLSQPLSDELSENISQANWVLHLAWARGQSLEGVSKENFAIIDNIFSVLSHSAKFCFISSVAASPEAKSTYGKAKYMAMQQVGDKGGISLVLGLVAGKPAGGAFRILLKFVKYFPISFRLKKNIPKVYPLNIDNLFSAIKVVLETDGLQGQYRLFGEGLSLNVFFEILEKKYPRPRLSIRLSTNFFLKAIIFIDNIPFFPRNITQKLITFLFKNEVYLAQHRLIPGFDSDLDSLGEF